MCVVSAPTSTPKSSRRPGPSGAKQFDQVPRANSLFRLGRFSEYFGLAGKDCSHECECRPPLFGATFKFLGYVAEPHFKLVRKWW